VLRPSVFGLLGEGCLQFLAKSGIETSKLIGMSNMGGDFCLGFGAQPFMDCRECGVVQVVGGTVKFPNINSDRSFGLCQVGRCAEVAENPSASVDLTALKAEQRTVPLHQRTIPLGIPCG
jgi:hypothetical protein